MKLETLLENLTARTIPASVINEIIEIELTDEDSPLRYFPVQDVKKNLYKDVKNRTIPEEGLTSSVWKEWFKETFENTDTYSRFYQMWNRIITAAGYRMINSRRLTL